MVWSVISEMPLVSTSINSLQLWIGYKPSWRHSLPFLHCRGIINKCKSLDSGFAVSSENRNMRASNNFIRLLFQQSSKVLISFVFSFREEWMMTKRIPPVALYDHTFSFKPPRIITEMVEFAYRFTEPGIGLVVSGIVPVGGPYIIHLIAEEGRNMVLEVRTVGDFGSGKVQSIPSRLSFETGLQPYEEVDDIFPPKEPALNQAVLR